MGLVIIIKISSDLPQKSSTCISSEIFGNLWKFSETVWKHFRLYLWRSSVIFGNFQKMFGNILGYIFEILW